MLHTNETEIQQFYRNKIVFLTGGTGFLGKVFIEKLLRTTEVQKIFVLIRPKKDKQIQERLVDIFTDPLFKTLNALKPDAAERVIGISGDCQQPRLGLTPSDREVLINNVDVIVHSAATVRFDEPLSTAITINLLATMDMLQLAHEMTKLQSFVHVSTAFANCIVPHIDERFYTKELAKGSDSVCQSLRDLGPDAMNRLTNDFIQDFPNTYCFTKALGEDAVLKHGSDLPICVFRPGVVIPTWQDPVSGWMDNLYGPMTILMGAAMGVLRVVKNRMDATAHIVPVDVCANTMIACAWETARLRKSPLPQEPRIYNMLPDERNTVTWRQFKDTVDEHGPTMPLTQMIWYPFLIATNSEILFKILWIFYHVLPGALIDSVLTLMGKKRRLMKIYKKIYKNMMLTTYFTAHDWTFSLTNTNSLWQRLSADDRRLYNFDMMSINWRIYFYQSLGGVRLYLCKEEPETIPKAVKLYRRFKIMHQTVVVMVCGAFSMMIYPLLIKLLT